MTPSQSTVIVGCGLKGECTNLMRIYAHRGSSGTEPENTLRGFRQALIDGAAGIEFDVHASADGVPVVIHDRDLARTTNGTGFVDSHSLKELRKLDAGKGEQIPTLVEVLELSATQVHLDIEIKQGGIEREVLTLLANYPKVSWAISSFEWSILSEARKLDSAAHLWPLTIGISDQAMAMALELGSSVIALHTGALDAQSAARLAENNLNAIVWTVNDVARARAMRAFGAIGLCTDYPARIISGLLDG